MEVSKVPPDMDFKNQLIPVKKKLKKFNLRNLRLSLKYRPEILKLVLKMRQCIKKKNRIIITLKEQLITVVSSIITSKWTNSKTKQNCILSNLLG